MAKRILVPLDRSGTAERVLAVVGPLARDMGATVRLLHVAPAPDDIYEQPGPAVAYTDQAMSRLEAEATVYLRGVGAGLGDVRLQTAVRFGDPATGILREASSFAADLLVLAACACGGRAQPVLGRVTAEVCRRATMPVVVWHAARSIG